MYNEVFWPVTWNKVSGTRAFLRTECTECAHASPTEPVWPADSGSHSIPTHLAVMLSCMCGNMATLLCTIAIGNVVAHSHSKCGGSPGPGFDTVISQNNPGELQDPSEIL